MNWLLIMWSAINDLVSDCVSEMNELATDVQCNK